MQPTPSRFVVVDDDGKELLLIASYFGATAICILCFFALAALFSSCESKSKQSIAGSNSAGPMAYKTVTVYSGNVTLVYTVPATIQGEQNIEIRPKVDGYIQSIFIDEGAVVQKGQPLFNLRNPQYEAGIRNAASSVKIAEADVSTAEMNVEKVRPLVEKNIISQYELSSQQYTLQSKKASLSSAQADLLNAKVNLSYLHLTSPARGTVGSIPYKVGALITASSPNPLTTVYNTNRVYAYFSLNEKDLLNFLKLVKGATLQDKLRTMLPVTLQLADGSVYPQQGRVTTATGPINSQTGSANFRATFPNEKGLLRSGNSAILQLPVVLDTALLIPQSATFDRQGRKFVYKLIGKDSITNVPIEVNEITVKNLYVVKRGLTKKDAIVIEGISNLKPKRIKPVPANKDSVYAEMKTNNG